MKKLLISLLVAATLAVGANVNAAGNDITVLVNETKVDFPDAKPFVVNGRTMVPVRFVSQSLGSSVDWEPKTETVVMANVKGHDVTTVLLQIGAKKATVNGKEITFDAKAILRDGRTFVPLRFVSESFGAKVDWDGSKRLVTITTPDLTTAYVPPVTGEVVNGFQTLDSNHDLLLPKDAQSEPILLEFIKSLKVDGNFVTGKVPSNLPNGYTFTLDYRTEGKKNQRLGIREGESFSLEINGESHIFFALAKYPELKNSVYIGVPSMTVEWGAAR